MKLRVVQNKETGRYEIEYYTNTGAWIPATARTFLTLNEARAFMDRL